MEEGEDFYSILQVSRSTNADEIRRSYQRLAKQVSEDTPCDIIDLIIDYRVDLSVL